MWSILSPSSNGSEASSVVNRCQSCDTSRWPGLALAVALFLEFKMLPSTNNLPTVCLPICIPSLNSSALNWHSYDTPMYLIQPKRMELVNRLAPQHWPLPAPADLNDGWKAGRIKGGTVGLRSDEDRSLIVKTRNVWHFNVRQPITGRIGFCVRYAPWWAWGVIFQVRERERERVGVTREAQAPCWSFSHS